MSRLPTIDISGDVCNQCGARNRINKQSKSPPKPVLCAKCYGKCRLEGPPSCHVPGVPFPGELQTAHSIARLASFGIEKVTREVRAGTHQFTPTARKALELSAYLLEGMIAEALHGLMDLERCGIVGTNKPETPAGAVATEGAEDDGARIGRAPAPLVVTGQGEYANGYTPAIGGGR